MLPLFLCNRVDCYTIYTHRRNNHDSFTIHFSRFITAGKFVVSCSGLTNIFSFPFVCVSVCTPYNF
jgi:hypothetical protein